MKELVKLYFIRIRCYTVNKCKINKVNKCSGSCNTLDNPMSKICIPKIIKNVNMQVYNFLMRLNETRIVL